MPRFMGFVRMEEGVGTPPQALFDAMDAYIGEQEAKEVVGGWAIMQYDTLEEAVADQQEFAELHAKYWPEVTVISTLRQISTGPEAPGD
jgi:hypothetical protein